jgi:hypothetical protein
MCHITVDIFAPYKLYARFDDKDFQTECKHMLKLVSHKNDPKINMSNDDVVLALNNAKSGKACGPDKIYGRVIKLCKTELAVPLLKLYQMSLDRCTVPTAWKTSEIVPVPKIKIPLAKNDLRPVALTSVLMKCFELIVKKHLFLF